MSTSATKKFEIRSRENCPDENRGSYEITVQGEVEQGSVFIHNFIMGYRDRGMTYISIEELKLLHRVMGDFIKTVDGIVRGVS